MEPFCYRVKKDRIRVIDGDTISIEGEGIELGFGINYLGKNGKGVKCRFVGINTPEKRGPTKAAGLAAKARLTEIIENGETLVIQSMGVGKFGRVLTILEVDGVDVNQQLIDEGHAVPYFGGKR
tara:strand:- start:1067 stop:1438 length:372 start_codon:yes stop_codon:yes gene_type:complete